MPLFYVNKKAQANGDHEVHRADYCPTPADEENRHYLGIFDSCREAVAQAKTFYPQSNGCAFCSPECHTA
jgi:hypothetical protein